MNYIIFAKNESAKAAITTAIKNNYYGSKERYEIYEYELFNKENYEKIKKITGFNLYIIDIDIDGEKSFNVVQKIRSIDGYKNPIVLIYDETIDIFKYIKYGLIFNVIKKDKNFYRNIRNSILKINEITKLEDTFNFEYYNEIYRIPYRSIYYFEKDANANSITLHTKNKTYTFYSTISDIYKKLETDSRFIKTHRSVIINIHKVVCFDKSYNEIVFDNNKRVYIVCRRQKKNLIQKLENNNDYQSNKKVL